MLGHQVYRMPQECSHFSQWVYSSSGSQSPASSLDSYNVSPAYTTPRENVSSYHRMKCTIWTPTRHRSHCRPQGRTRCKMVGNQRHSASEREKMRMRSLSKALHNLRRYLPPSVAPAGRNLTKIETLRLTIQYISYLSELLGITTETMDQSREHKPAMNNPYSVIPEGCQQMTCSQYHQAQTQSQSAAFHEQSYPCSKSRISSIKLEHAPNDEDPWMSTPYDRQHSTAADFHMSPYCPRFTHLYQVAEYHCPTTVSPSLKENDCIRRTNHPLLSPVNGSEPERTHQ